MSIQQKYYFILFLNNRLKCQNTSSSQALFPHHELVILSSNLMTEAVKKGSRNAKKFYKKRYVRGYTLPMSLSVEGKCLSMICLFLMVSYTPAYLIRSIKLLKLLGNLRLGWHLETKSFPPHSVKTISHRPPRWQDWRSYGSRCPSRPSREQNHSRTLRITISCFPKGM